MELELCRCQTVFAHASCIGDKERACAGIGLFFGPSDSRNSVEVLPYGKQTHNRAYIYAAVRALQLTYCTWPMGHKPVRVLTRSKYLVCMCFFFTQVAYILSTFLFTTQVDCVPRLDQWSTNGWVKKNREKVKNIDLWMMLLLQLHNKVQFVHITRSSKVPESYPIEHVYLHNVLRERFDKRIRNRSTQGINGHAINSAIPQTGS